jgi:hypothetical protein
MPGGRPSKIDQVVRTREDGTPVTAADHLLDRIRLGAELQTACDSAGLSRATLHNWRLRGGRARAEAVEGVRLKAADRRLVEFVDALERAEAEAEVNRLAIISRAAQGGAVVTKTTTKYNAAGDVLERTVVTETLRPEWTAAAWWLERRKPRLYARRLEVTGAEGAPLVPADDAARALADSAREYLAAKADG